MKHKMRIGLTVASVALAAAFASAQSSKGAVQVTVDGNPVRFEAAQPQVMGGRVLVPLRGVFEQIGANVDWDANTQSVIIDGNGRHIRLQVGSFDANINGRVVTMDVAPQLISDSTMIPLRFLSQSLGDRVDWQPQEELVAITTMPQVAEHFAPPPPAQTPPPQPPIIVNPPPPPTVIVNPPPIVVQAPPPAARPETFTFGRDAVIPMRLDQELSSNNNHADDHFVASVRGDAARYMDFPEGTVVEGYVRAANRAGGSHGGTLDIRFTHIRFPDGARYRLIGAVAPLDSHYIIRTGDGRFVARNGRDNVVAEDAAEGAGAGLIVGSFTGHAVGGAVLGGAIGSIVGAFDHSLAHNVIFPAGTRFGLILGDDLTVDRHDLDRHDR